MVSKLQPYVLCPEKLSPKSSVRNVTKKKTSTSLRVLQFKKTPNRGSILENYIVHTVDDF